MLVDIFLNKQLIDKARRLRQVLEGTTIKRNTHNTVSGKLISSNIPPTKVTAHKLTFDAAEQSRTMELLDVLPLKKGKRHTDLVFYTDSFKKSILFDFLLDTEYLLHYKAKKCQQMRKAGKTAPDIAQEVVDRKLEQAGDEPRALGPSSQDALAIFASNSPKIRECFRITAELQVLLKERIIFWTYYPAPQLILTEICIMAKALVRLMSLITELTW